MEITDGLKQFFFLLSSRSNDFGIASSKLITNNVMPPGRSVLILEYLKFWGKNLQKAAYEHDIMCEKTYNELLIHVFSTMTEKI